MHLSSLGAASRCLRILLPAPLLLAFTVSIAGADMQVASGIYTGNETTLSVTGLGFAPDVVLIKGDGNEPAVMRTSTMPSDRTKSLVDDEVLFAGAILSFDTDGFTLGADQTVNKSGREFTWAAFSAEPGQLVVGSYVGDGVDDRLIGGLGLSPDYVIVLSEGATHAWHRSSATPGDSAFAFQDIDPELGRIVGLEADGFRVGSDLSVNEPGTVFHYVAWAATSGGMATGTYLGTGNAAHNVTVFGFSPELVIVRQVNGNEEAMHRVRPWTGPSSAPFRADGFKNSRITATLPTGFQTGNHNTVNGAGDTYFWVAFAPRRPLQLASGTYIGDGVATRHIPVGFSPGAVIVKRDAFNGAYLRTQTMPNGASKALATGAPLSTGRITSLDADGFELGNQADVNEAGATYHWTAFGAEASLSTVSYVGDGSDNRAITGLGLTPGLAIVASEDGHAPVFRMTAMGPGESAGFGAEAPAVNLLQDFVPDGLVVGSNDRVNKVGTTYHVLVLHDAPDRLVSGSYVGDGTDNRNILGVGFAPDFLLLKPHSIWTTAQRPDALAGDRTALFAPTPHEANNVQALLPDGFQVGTSNRTNPPGTSVYWTALRSTVKDTADLGVTVAVDDPTPYEGDAIRLTIRLENLGGGLSTAQLKAVVPTGLTYIGSSVTHGTYAVGSGLWTDITVAAGDTATLILDAEVDSGTGGSSIVAGASITYTSMPDPNPNNDEDDVRIDVTPVSVLFTDIAVTKSVNDPAPFEGDTIRYTITAENRLGGDASGIEVRDVLPAELTFVSATDTRGAYSEVSSIWSIPAMAGNSADTLWIEASVDSGTVGRTVTNTASLAAVDGIDLNGLNNADSAALTVVTPVDVAMHIGVDDPTPAEGDTILYVVAITNTGALDATAVDVSTPTPAGLTHVSYTATSGTYNAFSGGWRVPLVAGGASDTLRVHSSANAGTLGDTITRTASLSSLDQTDTDSSNDVDSVDVLVTAHVADASVSIVTDEPLPSEGEEVTLTVDVTNAGPNDANGLVVGVPIPSGLSFVSAVSTSGTYNSGSGTWSVGSVRPDDMVRLTLTVTVDPGTGGSAISVIASITDNDTFDPNADGDADSVTLNVLDPSSTVVSVSSPDESPQTISPGRLRTVLRLSLVNTTPDDQTLSALTLTNASSGPGTQAQLDASWLPLDLRLDQVDGSAEGTPVWARQGAAFANGTLRIGGLSITVRSGDVLRLSVRSGASFTARDGDDLLVGLVDSTAVELSTAGTIAGDWPVESARFTVDGMLASQITVHAVPAGAFLTGSTRNVVLDVTLPPNGYEPDVLNRLNIENLGSAEPGADLSAMEAWADEGDGSFSPGQDTRLGGFVYTGDRWELTGLSTPAPVGGLRVYVTVDIAPDADQGRTIRLSLPTLPDVGVGMASDNDGPIDTEAFNPFAQSISVADRVILSTSLASPGTTQPGAADVPLLGIVATNTYVSDRELTSLTVTNGTQGLPAATTVQLDGALSSVVLRADGNDNGVLDGTSLDPVIGSGVYAGGRVTFGGLAWTIPGNGTGHLFLTGNVSTSGARDGDVLNAFIEDAGDLTFGTPTAVVASWPLNSESAWTINGMIAQQLLLNPLPPATLGAGDGPHVALDVIVPPNGYEADRLGGLRLVNAGTATNDDVSDVRLWRDDGNGAFDPGSDVQLGPFLWLNDGWVSPVLDEPLPAGGTRMFVAVTVDAAPTDSSTIRLRIPINGVTVDTGNDGPFDLSVTNPSELLLSTAPLLSTLTIDPPVSTIGQSVTVRMTVENVGSESVSNVTPSALSASGTGALSFATGPTPTSFPLGVGETSTFTWTYDAVSAGPVTFSGSATGTGDVSTLPRTSLPGASNTHDVVLPASGANLFAVANMPFTITLGQTDIVPLTLTLDNPNGDDEANIEIRSLRIRLEDDGGNGIVPDSLLNRVVIREGANVYLDKTALETSGAEIDLTLDTPVVISGSQPVTLGIRVDISPDASSPTFRVTIEDPSWIVGVDAVGGTSVPIALQDGTYPIRSGLGRLVEEATGITMASNALAPTTSGPGQTDVPLFDISVVNVGTDGITSNVHLGEFAFTITDTTGAPIADAADVLSRVRVRSGVASLADQAVTPGNGPTVTVTLSPFLDAVVNTPTPLMVLGDVSVDASVLAVCTDLADTTTVEAWDATTGRDVPASYPSGTRGGAITVQSLATSIMARGTPRLPDVVGIGARNVHVLTGTLTHTGDPSTADVIVDSLRVRLQDEERNPLDPVNFVDALRVEWQGSEVAAAVDPGGVNGTIHLALSGLTLAPGTSGAVDLFLDIEASAPETGIELIIEASGIAAKDVNVGSSVAVQPEPGFNLPLTSGFARLLPPPDELVVTWTDRMPAVLIGSAEEVSLVSLALTNTASGDVGSIPVEGLIFRAADRNGAIIPIGAALSALHLYVGDSLLASHSGIAFDDTVATLLSPAVSFVAPGEKMDVDVRAVFRSDARTDGVRVGIDQDDVLVQQPGSGLLAIRIEPAAGTTFPYWTNVGNFTPSNLADSYANFPNPFAAGREETTFVYTLEGAAHVTLRVFAPRGERVRTLLDGASRAGGLHQVDRWDGRNGRGDVVRSGVYVAEISVRYDAGGSDTIRRKVLVVR